MTASTWPWLTARPIAHRGLHDGGGAVENTIAAAEAAVRAGFAIECDVRLSADGEAVVFHDSALDRLTLARGRVDTWSTADLETVAFKRGQPGVPSLAAWLVAVADRVPVIVEVKSEFDGDVRIADRVAACVARYHGRVAVKSFDVAIMGHLRRASLARPLGLVAEAVYAATDWADLSADQLSALRRHAGLAALDPDFLSWAVDDLPHPLPASCRARQVPVLAWTVRTAAQRARADQDADAMIFEGIWPATVR